MTRKDFVLIADAVHETPMLDAWHREAVANSLADALRTQNPRFDRERFITACMQGA